MGKIDTAGTYTGEILESGLGTTQKGFPQWVARLKAEQKYVDDADGMKHFGLTEPGYVDWSEFAEEIVGYMVLFNNAEAFTADTKLLNYEQLQAATDWDGTEFDSLGNGTFVGKKILFRVEENEYQGKSRLQVNWIDAPDAPAERTLKTLDSDKIKGLNAKLSFTKKAKPATAAKAPASPTKPVPAASVAATPATTAKGAAATSRGLSPTPPVADTAKTPAAPKMPKAPKKAEAPAPTPTAPAGDDDVPGLPGEVTQAQAWAYVISHKGDNGDNEIADGWLSACQEVGPDVDEADFTNAMWAKVRDTVVKDFSLT